ncbi:YjiH family protein [Natrinema salifodinae]|uniref:Nucleoside recognition GATE domain-containing membrane protein YjiH n=1 Tax=Natrinema salifodinae TaxID=1202768 RepID=A0A1I0LYJ9_9EURY|nr:nucleoside recognition domain-containing protein [Natrinema salifodinae]SEV80230.1 nucleoside recognition GATE domain-containing membrane protein YjiH [Natrinema salifodinae]
MFGRTAWENDDHMSGESTEPEAKTIDDVTLIDKRPRPLLKFILAFGIGSFFFLFPIEWNGQTTIPLDVVVSQIQESFPTFVELFTFALIVAGGVLTTLSMLHYREIVTFDRATVERLELDYWQTSSIFWAFRVVGILLAIPILLGTGPAWLFNDGTSGIVWGALLLTIALVIPIGAVFVNLLAELGGLQFVGTLSQPVMRPLFNLPGRAALDSAASWLGSFSIGYYLTRNVFDRGGYNKRDVFVICTCFATGNLGTVGAIAAVLDILHVFPIVVFLYLLSVLVTAVILVRMPPLSTVPDEYVAEPDPEPEFSGSVGDYIRFAFNEAVRTAEKGESIPRSAVIGLIDGMKLTAMMVGTILTIAMSAMLLNEYTSLFAVLSTPLVPVLSAFGIPDPQTAATGLILGGAEMFIGATFAVGSDLLTKVFVVIVVSSQAIFFAASAPMMVDMFDDIPIRFRDLFVLFVLRTVLLIPITAGLIHAARIAGLL